MGFHDSIRLRLNYQFSVTNMSGRFSLNKSDLMAWGERTLQTLAPYLVALIPVVIDQVPKGYEHAVLVVWILNRIYDLLRRYVASR